LSEKSGIAMNDGRKLIITSQEPVDPIKFGPLFAFVEVF
jgi:hypothetical protein